MSIGTWQTLSESWVTDDLVAASDMNDIEHDINYVHGVMQNGVRVYHAAGATSISDKTWTTLSFDSERYDDFTESQLHIAGSLEKLFARLDGKYLVFATIRFAGNTGGYMRQLRIKRVRSGGETKIVAHASFPVDKTASGTQPISMTIATVCEMLAGDHVILEVWHDAGSALNVVYDSTNEYTNEFGMTMVQDG